MRGRWRLFRQDAARTDGPGLSAFLALYAGALALGTLSTRTLDAIVFWPANGVMIAALLVLPRRKAMIMLAAGIGLNLLNNLVRGDQMPFFALNVAMNAVEAVLACVIARRVCGAALDLRRPGRLIRFGLLAVTPTVLISASVSVALAVVPRDYGFEQSVFVFQRFFMVEALGALIVTPALLLLARTGANDAGRTGTGRSDLAVMALLFAVTALVFFQNWAPITFLILPFLVLAAFRLSPSQMAIAVIGVALIGGAATAMGVGPMALARLPDWPMLFGPGGVVARLSLYYLFMLIVVAVALPMSTVTSHHRRLMARLEARTAAAHAARRQAERSDAAKSRFLALMSHEMRTPLNSISGHAEVLALRPAADPSDREGLNQIRSAADALLSLVEDMLEISSDDDNVDLVSLRLAEIIAAAAAPHHRAAVDKKLFVTVEVRPDAARPLIGDPRRLRQALQHLIGNAVKFTSQGGVTVRADRLDGQVLIAVTDTGCGLDADRAVSLFDAFVQGDDSITRRHGGAGIGLTVVQRQAGLMGGDVVIDSRSGDGATFTLRLPLAESPALEAAEPSIAAGHASSSVPLQGPGRILVVDDHPSNREVARLMLTAMGCSVDQAEDGDEAVAMAARGAYDLILMDVRMPRVDGLAATRAIRALDGEAARAPILAVTADAMPEDVSRCLAAGMDGHLAKPISLAALASAMSRALDGRVATRPATDAA